MGFWLFLALVALWAVISSVNIVLPIMFIMAISSLGFLGQTVFTIVVALIMLLLLGVDLVDQLRKPGGWLFKKSWPHFVIPVSNLAWLVIGGLMLRVAYWGSEEISSGEFLFIFIVSVWLILYNLPMLAVVNIPLMSRKKRERAQEIFNKINEEKSLPE